MCLRYIIVKCFIYYGFQLSTIKRLSRTFRKLCFGTKLHSIRTSVIGLCVDTHLACRKVEQLYGGLSEEDTLCVETLWSS
jgi:hypothetical protein